MSSSFFLLISSADSAFLLLDFFRQFLDFYQLQPHHLPGNAIFYLSCYVSFMEGYIGLRPTRETFARFFSLRINSVQGKEIPKPKPPVQCGSCIIGSRQGSPFFKFSGLESCRAWQQTFFYVKNTGAPDLINLPAFNPGVPTKANWGYNPGTNHIETNRIIRFMHQLKRDTDICSDDIIRTFISRRVLPLKRRAHKISKMYGPGDPTKITDLPLSKEDVVLKARQICQTAMPMDWEWGFLPLSSTNPPTEEAKQRFPRIAAEQRGPCRKRPLDTVDPDPYIHWTDLKMGRTHTPRPDAPSAGTNPQVLDHATPLQAEVGHEFLEKLTSQGKKKKAPASEAGPSEAPPAKRPRQEVVGGKTVSKKNYRRREMPVSSGSPRVLPAYLRKALRKPRGLLLHLNQARHHLVAATLLPLLWEALQVRGARPLHLQISARRGTKLSLQSFKTLAPATSAPIPKMPGGWSLWLLPPQRKKKKTVDSSSSKPVPDSSAPAGSAPGQDAPDARSPPKTTPAPPPETPTGQPIVAKPTLPPSKGPSAAEPTPPPEGTKPLKPEPSKAKATASGTPASGPQPLVLHAGRAAVVAGEKASGQLGQITELTRGGNELGHLLDYAEKWNRADVSAATRGLGKDRLPAIDPAGPRCTEEHFMRLRRAVKELDNAWHDATNNVVSTADARKRLFEELLWEHRDLSEAHSKCQAIPEASIEALKTQLATLQAKKEELVREHRKALDAQETISRGLKDQLI
ncbi:hypothetical protein QYE76_032913 [Lolium multiflorum]|uniref:Transposase (putative) gypsy type domain-containing protein n=1 Tax=Lolium multiflorum TaxID=4521 RepID=A0AAD8QUD0_LOLMU|nr:hypothetical protein QYE76_032913 [Lolium multiflorum]